VTDSIKQMRENSQEFREALLKSERKRLIAAIAFVAVFAVLMLIRIFVLGSAMSKWGLFTSLLLIVCEYLVLRSVNRALQSNKDIPYSLSYVTLALECLFPALGIAFLASSRIVPEYRPLASPWVLGFFPFILLTVLRLRPILCWLSGIISTVGYLLAAASLGWGLAPGPDGFTAPQTAVLYFGSLLLVTGALAAGVANEFRLHVQAALREADTRHKLQRVEHELQIARSVQQSLLPKFQPRIAGFQIAGWNRSADDTGGDFYDWKRLADGRWAVVLADVTGHGIGPAILAAVCRAYSRASFNERDNLETILKNINQSFAEDLTPERFATFVGVVCEEGDDQVELVSAGHGPLFVYSSETKSCQYIDSQALPLGIMPVLPEVRPIKIAMMPGDILFLITDGFFEWENKNGEEFGVDRLVQIFNQNSHREPEIIIAELYESVMRFAEGTIQKDDLTAVLIKRIHGDSFSTESSTR
jgi:serine phosphatase RsbU (regulator of sigma subunit)